VRTWTYDYVETCTGNLFTPCDRRLLTGDKKISQRGSRKSGSGKKGRRAAIIRLSKRGEGRGHLFKQQCY